jgi:3-hydroxybutyryl-CoA dehydrogenase
MEVERVGLVGCGLMGRGIAEICARAGIPVTVREINQDVLDKGLGAVRASLARSLERKRIDVEEHDRALANLNGTVELSDLAGSDLVVEAIVEDLETKRELFVALDGIVGDACIFASNTSSLTLTQLAASTARPDRFVGLHFFNPVPAMRLVEVVRTLMTADEAYDACWNLAERVGKTPVACKDNSGFIVNRLLVPYLLDAVRAYENGVGSMGDIDTAMKLGCGYPMGPFTLSDFIGLDTMYSVANIMFDEYRETRFAPPTLLKQLVQAGHLGRKTGKGFFDYS